MSQKTPKKNELEGSFFFLFIKEVFLPFQKVWSVRLVKE